MSEPNILEGIKNFVGGYIDASGSVIVGDGNTIYVNIYKFEDYILLKKSLEDLNNKLTKAVEASIINPENEYIKESVLEFSLKVSQKKDEVKRFELEILKLASELHKIKTKSGRIQTANNYFLEGKLKEASNYLISEQGSIETEQGDLLKRKLDLFTEISEIDNLLLTNSSEYLLSARLLFQTSRDSSDNELILKYCERSIVSNKNFENTSTYATFLQVYNYIDKSIENYKGSLSLFELIDSPTEFDIYLQASCLNNLALLEMKVGSIKHAQNSLNKALGLFKYLATKNYDLYAIDIAGTYLNMAKLYQYYIINIELAEGGLLEALKIVTELTAIDKDKYNIQLNNMRVNLSVFYCENRIHIKEAEDGFLESLKFYKNLKLVDQTKYQNEIASCLINLSNLKSQKEQIDDALILALEAETIIEKLVKYNPRVYLQDHAEIMMALGNLYFKGKIKNLVLCEDYSRKSLRIFEDLMKIDPDVHLSKLALAQSNIAICLVEKGNYFDAGKMFDSALASVKKLYKNNEVMYSPKLVSLLVNISKMHEIKYEFREALDKNIEAKAILQKMTDNNYKNFEFVFTQIEQNIKSLNLKIDMLATK